MTVLSRAELDRSEGVGPGTTAPSMRPVDAATLIIFDRTGSSTRVLMGRRHQRHAFMPGKYVFPGGRTDSGDAMVKPANDLHPLELARLMTRTRISGRRARSIALSALREAYEEAGLLIGEPGEFPHMAGDWHAFARHAVRPALGPLRFVARAVTPPGRIRRFDTRFFALPKEAIAVSLPEQPTDELTDLGWLTLDEALQADVAEITRLILKEFRQRLSDDPLLSPGAPVPFFHMRGKQFLRNLI